MGMRITDTIPDISGLHTDEMIRLSNDNRHF